MSVTIPSLDPVTDILDTDKIMVTQSSGQTYTIDGASFNKRNQAVIASSTTLTGAPLKTGNIVRAYFTADITGVNTTTVLSLSYNGSSKNVKVPKNGSLANFTAQNMGGSPTVYKYLQAYTTLELLYDGTNFVIIGNPVVISSADYTIYADGLIEPTRTKSKFYTSYRKVSSGYLTSTNKIIDINIYQSYDYRSTIGFIINITANNVCYTYLLFCVVTDNAYGGIFSSIIPLQESAIAATLSSIMHDSSHYEAKVSMAVPSGANMRVTVRSLDFIDFSLAIASQ